MYTSILKLSNLIHEELQILLEQKKDWYEDLDPEFKDKYEEAIEIIDQHWFTELPDNVQSKYKDITQLYKQYLEWKVKRDVYAKSDAEARLAGNKVRTARRVVQTQVGKFLNILKKAVKTIENEIRRSAEEGAIVTGSGRGCDDRDIESEKERLTQLLNVMKLGNQFLETYIYYPEPLKDPDKQASMQFRGRAALFLDDPYDELRQKHQGDRSTVKRDKDLYKKLSEDIRTTQFKLFEYLKNLPPQCPRRGGDDPAQRPRAPLAGPPPTERPADEINLEYGITAPSKRVFKIMQKVWPGLASDKMKAMKLMTPCGQMAQKLQAIQVKIAEKLKSMNYTVTPDFNFVKYFHLKWATNEYSLGDIGYKDLHEIIENEDYGNFTVLMYDNSGRKKTVNIPPKPSQAGLTYYHFLNILEKLQLCNTGASLNHVQAHRIITILQAIKNNRESIILPKAILDKYGKHLILNVPEGVEAFEMPGGLNRILMLSNRPLKPEYFLPTRRGAEKGGVSRVPCEYEDGNPVYPIPKGCPGYDDEQSDYDPFN